LNRISALIGESGSDAELSADVAQALGFSETDQPWPNRQIATREVQFDASTPLHMIAMGRAGVGVDEIYVQKDATAQFIRIDRDGRAIKAITVNEAGRISTPVSIPEAQGIVDAELRFWAANGERAAHWQVCNAEMSGAHGVQQEKKIESCTWIIQSGKETPRDLANAYTSRGMAYERGFVPKELEDLHQATKVDPTCSRAWAQLCGVQNWITGETELAIQSCSKAIELKPLAPEGWTFRGDIYLKSKEYDLAIADYDHAIALNSDWMWPLDNRGAAYLRKNEIDRAIEDFDSVIRVSPDYSIGYLDRGIAELRKNDLDAALTDFQTGIKVNPHCASCLLGQGLVKRVKGDTAGGDADVAKAKEMNPKAGDAFVENGIPLP
jgi:tetratricopeptide (TPR) repeat protein